MAMLPEQDRSPLPASTEPKPLTASPVDPGALLEQQRLLLQISTAAYASASLEETLDMVVNRLKDAKIGDRISILLLNPAGQLQVEASAGFSDRQTHERTIVLGEGIAGKAAAEKRPLHVDVAGNAPTDLNLDPGVGSQLAVPLLFRDELTGILNLESTQENDFDANDRELLPALGISLGGIISNFRLVEQVRQQALHECQLFEATSHIRRSVDLQTILETAAWELAQTLGARRVRIRVNGGGMADDHHLPDQDDATPREQRQEIDNR